MHEYVCIFLEDNSGVFLSFLFVVVVYKWKTAPQCSDEETTANCSLRME